jgi:hypothetical protein
MDPKVETSPATALPTEARKDSALPTPARPSLDSWKPSEEDLYFPDLDAKDSACNLKPPFDAKVDGERLYEVANKIAYFRNLPEPKEGFYKEAGDIISRASANGELAELGVEFDRAYEDKQMSFAKSGKYAPSYLVNFSQAMSLSKDEILKSPNLFITAEDLKPLEEEALTRANEMSEKITKTRTDARGPALFKTKNPE